jgi:hypothetical protein
MHDNFILNETEKVAHRKAGLTEKCNTDDIAVKALSPFIPEGYRPCQHCHPEQPSPSP